MGRLTLNVLLSFAQFEREVTSERIRDKIAASKRKGLWTVDRQYHRIILRKAYFSPNLWTPLAEYGLTLRNSSSSKKRALR
jgi:DNA invertase Pin-like site-specific DNA recombinase